MIDWNNLKKEDLTLENLFKNMGTEEFKPCQYYIESLDWMIIQTRDCCTVDEYINEWFDLMYDGHTGDENGKNMELVGIKIKGYSCIKK